MSWAAAITTCGAELRLRFTRPVRVLELSPDKARELATVLLVAAEQATFSEPEPETLAP